MPADMQSMTITCESEESASRIASELMGLDSPAQTFRRENLHGDTVTWVVVAQSTVVTLPRILDGLAKVISSCKVRSFRVGERELRNPTAADIRAMKE